MAKACRQCTMLAATKSRRQLVQLVRTSLVGPGGMSQLLPLMHGIQKWTIAMEAPLASPTVAKVEVGQRGILQHWYGKG